MASCEFGACESGRASLARASLVRASLVRASLARASSDACEFGACEFCRVRVRRAPLKFRLRRNLTKDDIVYANAFASQPTPWQCTVTLPGLGLAGLVQPPPCAGAPCKCRHRRRRGRHRRHRRRQRRGCRRRSAGPRQRGDDYYYYYYFCKNGRPYNIPKSYVGKVSCRKSAVHNSAVLLAPRLVTTRFFSKKVLPATTRLFFWRPD